MRLQGWGQVVVATGQGVLGWQSGWTQQPDAAGQTPPHLLTAP